MYRAFLIEFRLERIFQSIKLLVRAVAVVGGSG